MPKTTIETSTTVEEQVTIAPKQKAQLVQRLRRYQDIKAQIALLEKESKDIRHEVGKVRDTLGVESLKVEGFTVTLVAPVLEKLNVKKLYAQGVTPAQIQAATDVTPGACYEKITLPRVKEDVDE